MPLLEPVTKATLLSSFPMFASCHQRSALSYQLSAKPHKKFQFLFASADC
jgi:hypothetical protein